MLPEKEQEVQVGMGRTIITENDGPVRAPILASKASENSRRCAAGGPTKKRNSR
jgi:hypothetical protein